MNIRSLDQAQKVNDYLNALEAEESSREFQTIDAGKLWLTPEGLLQAANQTREVSEEARKDLAKLAGIPVPYMEACDPGLRSINFNSRLPQFLGQEEALEVVISNDNAVMRVQRPRFGDMRPSQALAALVEAGPDDTVTNDIRVIEYERDGRFDVALVARAFEAQPRKGDLICGVFT